MVLFPFDETFPQYELARHQMRGACGLFTFAIKDGTMESITKFAESLKHILMAVSWGGHESLILPKCAGIEPGDFDRKNEQHQYIRMYVGLEDSSYIINDLDRALDSV